MTPSSKTRRVATLLCMAPLALGVAACGSTVSTSSFKGEEHAVAQTISNLQADATANEQGKICSNDLAAPVVARLGGTKRCETAIKAQLTEIDSLEVSVQSIKLGAGGTTATAAVTSTYGGKKKRGTVTLVKEGGKWKVSALG
jgi:monoamine oxidase